MYDYVTTKPELNDETLAHYGIKGMKWRKKTQRLSDALKEKRKRNYYARKMADDVLNGRRKYRPNDADMFSNGILVDRDIYSKSKGYSIVGGARKDKSRKNQVQASTKYRKKGEAFNTFVKTYYTSKNAVDSELKKRKKRKAK